MKTHVIYIAARYDRIDEMNHVKHSLEANGFKVNSRWLNGSHQLHPSPEKVDTHDENVAWEACPFAQDDLEDVSNCEVLIFFSEPANSHSKRGGRHVEFGIALALGKRIMTIGNRENVFHCLPNIEHYQSIESCIESLLIGSGGKLEETEK